MGSFGSAFWHNHWWCNLGQLVLVETLSSMGEILGSI